jgi:hypothetical protein
MGDTPAVVEKPAVKTRKPSEPLQERETEPRLREAIEAKTFKHATGDGTISSSAHFAAILKQASPTSQVHLMRQFQRRYGNAYTQGIVSHIRRREQEVEGGDAAGNELREPSLLRTSAPPPPPSHPAGTGKPLSAAHRGSFENASDHLGNQLPRLAAQDETPALQRKLTVGAADDQYEQEADRMARQVLSTPDAAAAVVQRQGLEDEGDKSIQARSARVSDSFEAGADVETQVSLSKGRGGSLPDSVRTYMEPRFGVDLGHVHVHTDREAVQMNREVGAQAFTHGSDIYYGAGSSPTNLELTAHELTHVLQQTGSVPAQTKPSAETSSAGSETSIQQIGAASISSLGMQMLNRLKSTDAAPGPTAPATTASAATVSGSPSSSAVGGANNSQSTSATTATVAGPQQEGGASAAAAPPPSTGSGSSAGPSEAATTGSHPGNGAGGAKSTAAGPEAGAPSPGEAIGPVAAGVRDRAADSREHSEEEVLVDSAQESAKNPQTEQTRAAAEQTVANINKAAGETKTINPDDFKQKLKAAIAAATPIPKTESAAEELMKNGATKTRSTMRGHLTTERDAAEGPLKSTSSAEVPPSDVAPPTTKDLKAEPIGPPPAPVSAAPVVPPALPPERLDYSADRAPADKLMEENNVNKEQLEKGNEPTFGAALDARSTAEKHEATAAGQYRQSETDLQAKARVAAQATLTKDLSGMHGDRAQRIGQVVGKQAETKAKDAAERQRVTDTINGIKNTTKSDVDAILKPMETEAEKIFEAGLTLAEKAYSDTFEEEKGGVGTWLTTWGDDWQKHIESSLSKARDAYLAQVDSAVDKVANYVEKQLAAAKKRVADGLREVETFVNSLDKSVAQFGKEALQSVSKDFDAMRTEINERRDSLINKLAQQYKNSYDRMSAMETKLRDENKSLWQRVYDATVGLVKKILAFKDMLLGILAKAAGVINDIIDDPIGFLGNLVSAIAQGLNNFIANIGAHLKKGLMAWIFGALAGAGLQMPEAFDLKGIVSIVLQVLGLTYANFRARAVAIVGEPVVGALEKAAEVFKVLVTEGIPGLWRFIQEKVGDLKAMVLDAIFEFIKENVIVAGIKWVISLLNPASAFFKACMAIYDIVMFFINRGSQIIELVNAVTDSVAAIAKGSLGAAASMVENALAKAIPVTIGFVAGLLGLGDISTTIKNTIDKAQAPVNKAIDWAINMAVKGVKAAGKLLGIGKDKDKPDDKLQQGLTAAQGAIARFSGKKVGALVLKPLLFAIKVRYGLQSLEAVPEGNHWAVRGTINPTRTITTDVLTDQDEGELSEQELMNMLMGQVTPIVDTPQPGMVENPPGAPHETVAVSPVTTISVSSLSLSEEALYYYIDVSPATPERRASVRKGVEGKIATAQTSQDSHDIYKALQQAGGMVNSLYPKKEGPVVIHHETAVKDYPETFPETQEERVGIPKPVLKQMVESIKKIMDKYKGMKELTAQQKKEGAQSDIKELAELIKKSLLDWKLTREKDRKGRRTRESLPATAGEVPLDEIDLIAGSRRAHITVHQRRGGS